jgi:hypothetical protein
MRSPVGGPSELVEYDPPYSRESRAGRILSTYDRRVARQTELRDDVAETRTCSLCGVVFKSWRPPIKCGPVCEEFLGAFVIARKQWVAETVRAVVAKRVAKLGLPNPAN